MAIVDLNGFKFYDGLNAGCMVIEGDKLDNCIKYVNDNNVRWISLCDLFYSLDNIDFLIACPKVEKLDITSTAIIDYTGIYYLKNLQSLSLEMPRGRLDLSTIPSLRELSIDGRSDAIGFDKLHNLLILRLWGFNPKSKNLTGLKDLTDLEELYISQSNITSLSGCGSLINLKILELNYLPKLETIIEIDELADTLLHLRFYSCKKIKDHHHVASLRNLQLLAFDECGEIQSVGFIRQMENLKSFIFVNTNIVDGDLSPCIGLEYVGFLDKRHYSHKNIDFNRRI